MSIYNQNFRSELGVGLFDKGNWSERSSNAHGHWNLCKNIELSGHQFGIHIMHIQFFNNTSQHLRTNPQGHLHAHIYI